MSELPESGGVGEENGGGAWETMGGGGVDVLRTAGAEYGDMDGVGRDPTINDSDVFGVVCAEVLKAPSKRARWAVSGATVDTIAGSAGHDDATAPFL